MSQSTQLWTDVHTQIDSQEKIDNSSNSIQRPVQTQTQPQPHIDTHTDTTNLNTGVDIDIDMHIDIGMDHLLYPVFSSHLISLRPLHVIQQFIFTLRQT